MAGPAVEIIDFEPRLAVYFKTLNEEWLERYFRVEPIDQDILSRPEEQILAGGGAILFAEQHGEVVGTAALKHQGGGNYELTKMAVTERCRGAGVGRKLLEACIDRYQALAGARLYLESHSSLKSALYLYESAGFEHRPRPAPSDYERSDVYMVYRQD